MEKEYWETEEGKASLQKILNKEYFFNKDGTITRRDGHADEQRRQGMEEFFKTTQDLGI